VGEPQVGQTGRRVGLIADPITRLLGRRPVVAKPIGLDDQTEIRPEEIDLEAVDPAPGERQGKPSRFDHGQEASLELGVGEAEAALAEHLPENTDTTLAGKAFERGEKRFRIRQVEPVCLIDGPLDDSRLISSREIYERAYRAGDRDLVALRHVLW